MDFSPFCYFCFLGQNFNNMGKSTHFIGQPVYNQVIKLLDKQQIKQISLETPRSEAYVKRLDGWTHLVIMLFGILKHFDSLR
ncbi:mobile element protein [Prevotella intermedia]|uniref:Mobile element protein n=2 Tax=Prevotella intermedia TaxID=28131 RepID=A0AAD1BKH1_PREIN|nr:mobile element protein [Prevotella intermedia]BAR96938.1 mobile element protein [Prevotella intermedia]